MNISHVPLNVLIVPDKFKGTLTAQQAADAMADGWRAARPLDHLELLPMSDGGDGFGEVMGFHLAGQIQQSRTVDAAHHPIDASWWWCPASATAIIETARIVGLAMLPPGKFHPFELDTYGLGVVLRDAATLGARRCILGIGGSATNDAGFGVARALGWQFYNDHEETISRWSQLNHLASIRPPQQNLSFDDVSVAVDVQNPLLGPNGCSRVYGPQKGLTEFEFAESCLGRLVEIWERQFHVNHASLPGSGAAGGLGFGLVTFLGAKLLPGFSMFSDATKFEERVRNAHIVLTGEGALDDQTLMGKGVGEVAQLCRRLGIPCLGLAGAVPNPDAARKIFDAVFALDAITDRDSALREPSLWLERMTAQVAAYWQGAEPT
ncbi:MAG TPA: glycerate kinase, partial [Verrucomicrobiae bacterium]|nr:glycerate kinase [Verrucomicrobiae bacterium]